MLSYTPSKINLSAVEIGVSLSNTDYATENTLQNLELEIQEIKNITLADANEQLQNIDTKLQNIRDITLADANEQLQNIQTELVDNNLGVTFNNTQIEVSNNPPLTAIPTYFEFTGLNVNDSSVSRLVQNSTGSAVYITGINFFSTDSSHSIDYNVWYNANTCEHILDVCSSNNNYPTNSVRKFFEAQDSQEQWSRYEKTRIQTGGFSLGNNHRPTMVKIRYDPPVLCEKDNYVRLFKNGSTTHFTSYRITVIGYY